MTFKTLDKSQYSIKQILDNNGHYVIYSSAFSGGNLDSMLVAQLAEIGISENEIWRMIEVMNSNPIFVSGQINPIYQCGTLYPLYNITLMDPYFGGLYFQNYIEDILEANNMMGTKELYFSHHYENPNIDSIKNLLSEKWGELDITINFLV